MARRYPDFSHPYPVDARPRISVPRLRVVQPRSAAPPSPHAAAGPTVVAPQNAGLPSGNGAYTTPHAPAAPYTTPGGGPAAPPSAQTTSPYLTDDQIQAQAAARAKAIYDPMIQQVVDSINRRGQEGAAAIAALTGAYAKAAAGYAAAIPGIYGPAKAEIATAVQFLSDRLKGEGATTGKDLASALEQAGQQNTSGIDLAQIGTGAGNAAYGTGIAELDALIAREAADQTFAAGEPSRAFAGGQQQTADFQRYLTRLLADQTGQITAQIPQTAEQIAESLTAREDARRSEDERIRERNQDIARADAQRAQDLALHNRERAQDMAVHNRERAQELAHQRAVDAENRRRYAAAQAENRRRYNESLRERRAGIVGPHAPTVGGRKAYYDKVAAQRTSNSGIEYVGTPAGIRPLDADPTKPGLQPSYTQAGETNRENIINSKVQRIVALGTVTDPKTGQPTLTPTARREIKALTGTDPGTTPPGTKPPKPPKVSTTLSAHSKYLIDENGDVVLDANGKPKLNPSYQPPKKNEPVLDVTGSKGTGRWQWKGGKPLTPEQIKAMNLPPKPPKPSAGGNDRGKAVQAATGIVTDLAEAAVKRVPVYKQTPKTDAFGNPVTDKNGKPVTERTAVGSKLSSDYYATIHQAEVAVEPYLAPFMTRSQIIRFVQRIVNTYYKAGKGGRPNVGVKPPTAAEKTGPSGTSVVTRKPKPPAKPASPTAPSNPFGP